MRGGSGDDQSVHSGADCPRRSTDTALVPDYKSVEREYFQTTDRHLSDHARYRGQAGRSGDKYTWVVVSLVKAFDKAKNIAYRRIANPRITPLAWVRRAYEEERKLLGPDPRAYGLGESNRKNLETIVRDCHEQGIGR
jgi:4,5-dihydroxyphthalate decarboxylase